MLNKVLLGERNGPGGEEIDQSISSPGEETDWRKNRPVTPGFQYSVKKTLSTQVSGLEPMVL